MLDIPIAPTTLSTFSISFYSEQQENDTWISQAVKNFSKLIDSRIKYTRGLKELPQIWISGKSEKPDDLSIKKTEEVLKVFRDFIVDSYSVYGVDNKRDSKPSSFKVDNTFKVSGLIPIPKIVMAPIPSGGIEIELYKNPNDSIYISIPNNDQIATIEKQTNGFFEDVDIPSSNVSGVLIDEYKALSWK